MTVKGFSLVPSGAIGKVALAISDEIPVNEAQGSAFPAYRPARSPAVELEVQKPRPMWSSGCDEIEAKLEPGDPRSTFFINGIIELARNRATLISQIRELLVRGETQQVIPLVRILCGLEN